MGDKSPKSTKKRDDQRHAKAEEVNKKKRDIQQAKRTAAPKK